MQRHIHTVRHHTQRALRSKYGKVLVVAFFIPEASLAVGGVWAIIQGFL